MNVVLYHDGEGGADSREQIRRYEFFYDSPRVPRSMWVTPPLFVSFVPAARELT